MMGRVPTARLVPRVNVGQLDVEDGRLQAIQPVGVANHAMAILADAAMIPQVAHAVGQASSLV